MPIIVSISRVLHAFSKIAQHGINPSTTNWESYGEEDLSYTETSNYTLEVSHCPP